MWARRAQRARLLADRYPASEAVLSFYARLADWQAGVAERAHTLASLRDVFPSLLELVSQTGPPPLRDFARSLGVHDFDRLVGEHWHHQGELSPSEFFARSLLQPHVAAYPTGMDCPWCSEPPQVGLLRPQGDGLAFEVICGLCLRPRSHPRARCPGCGETSKDQLANLSAAEFPYLRLKACDACRGYLVLVDLSEEPKAVPEVDELAAGALDVWALEHGYSKLQPNIVGL